MKENMVVNTAVTTAKTITMANQMTMRKKITGILMKASLLRLTTLLNPKQFL
jgi:hypothetical protein